MQYIYLLGQGSTQILFKQGVRHIPVYLKHDRVCGTSLYALVHEYLPYLLPIGTIAIKADKKGAQLMRNSVHVLKIYSSSLKQRIYFPEHMLWHYNLHIDVLLQQKKYWKWHQLHFAYQLFCDQAFGFGILRLFIEIKYVFLFFKSKCINKQNKSHHQCIILLKIETNSKHYRRFQMLHSVRVYSYRGGV